MAASQEFAKTKALLLCSLAGLVMLLVLSVFFWRERVFMLDASFQSFSIVAAKDWAFQVERYGAAMVQGLPLLLAKMGAPLLAVLLSYSMSFTLYPLVLFGLLWWMKQHNFALVFALFFLLIMTHTFFWIQSELIQASAIAIFACGLGSKASWHWGIRLPLTLLAVVLCIYTHPLGIAPLLFGLVFLGFGSGGKLSLGRFATYCGLGLLSVGLFFLIQFKLKTGAYDQSAMEMVTAVPEHFPNLFELNSSKNFLSQLIWPYPVLPLLFIAVLSWQLWHKQWWRLLTFLGAFVVWLIIVLCTWWYGPELFYVESYYLVLGVFLALPLGLDILPELPKRWVITSMSMLIVFRLVAILFVSQTYVERRQQIDTYISRMRQLPGERFAIKRDRLDKRLFEMDWGMPYATTLRSALAGPDSLATLLVYKDSIPEHVRHFEKTAMPTPWGPYKYDWFSGDNYFRFSDTTEVKDLPR